MTWRHTHVWGSGECDGQSTDDPRMPCGCTTPTPDPASPCAECKMPGISNNHADVDDCTVYPWGTGSCIEPEMHHPHQPTRCTCGHPIEEAPR